MGYVEVAMRQEGRFRRLYAVKRLHLHHRGDAGFRAMFMDEARVAGLVRHPNVVSVLDVGEDDDGPFLVMDYVDGVSLGAIIAGLRPADAPLPLALCVTVASQVARGLHAAHELRGEAGELLSLVHRDVSPQNILVGFDGTARVTDFGIAKAFGNVNRTATGLLKGNVGYMSPEQLRFETADRRSDLFSLGVVLFEALARKRLYRNTEPNLSARRILTEPPPDIHEIRADAPPELVQLLFELLAKETDLRPDSALEVAERLEGMLTLMDATDGRFDLATFLGASFGEAREQRRREIAEALAAVEAAPTAEAEPIRVAPVAARARAGSMPPGGVPASPEANAARAEASPSTVTGPPRPKRRTALALAAAGLAAALLWASRPAPVGVEAPAPPVSRTRAEALAGGAPALPAVPPPAQAPGPTIAARTEEPARARLRIARRSSGPQGTSKPATGVIEPPGQRPAASSEPGLVHLPRSEQSGSRKLEVPLATDWQ
jgi:serine/threonine-protein kinase